MNNTATETTVRFCEAIIHRATHLDDAEYCDLDAVEGEDFCEGHLAADQEDDYEPHWSDDDDDFPWALEYEEG
jgi:hypothetical protein